MSKHNLIPLSARDEWTDALKGIRHSFAHTHDNSHAMHLTTGHPTYLYRYESGNTAIVCPISERSTEGKKDIVTPYGFSGFAGNQDCPDFPNHWNEFVCSRGYICGYISLNPLFENKTYFVSEEAHGTASLHFIDLDKSLTDIFESLDANRRRQIKNYRKHESGFIYDKTSLTVFFKENYYDFLKRYNLSSANYFKMETLDYLCSLENVFMVGTTDGNKVNSVYIFAHTPYEGLCLFNVSHPEAKETTPLLLWCGLKYFRSKKIPVMNLGGGSSDDDNISNSKRRYGAYSLPFRSLKQIYDKNSYDELSRLSGAGNGSTYFPAYRDPALKK